MTLMVVELKSFDVIKENVSNLTLILIFLIFKVNKFGIYYFTTIFIFNILQKNYFKKIINQ